MFMSENQKKLIKKYFNSLVKEFITDPQHQNIKIFFQDYIKNDGLGETLGLTKHESKGGMWHWETINGVEVPDSRWQEPIEHIYKIFFLNHYSDIERWRGTVAHEFAHLYLFATIEGKHDHDDRFYFYMDYFEDWLDKKWNLVPRQDKSGDWQQHVNPQRRKQREKQNSNYFLEQNDTFLTPAERKGYDQLVNLLRNINNLTELEENYSKAKNNSLYSSNKKFSSNDNEKVIGVSLDLIYTQKKNELEKNKLLKLMKQAKNLSQLEQAYQDVKNNPLYGEYQKELDWEYRNLKNGFEINFLSKNQKFWIPLLIGGGAIGIIGLVFALLKPTKILPKRKKVNPCSPK
ncbi:MAG: hypothetical protein MRERC_3c102 [Mycoplasmataceae bacterium RC_NB112A]|nr:MAG: hypothetical protein MRERC_12c044 [Mycoplasmataceae bacterium RC_NB112A]KLL02253.1 MAG: hypothetical protein MRERC_3c102 [Mycoplasmataceae bacterium RC_NB112A]